MIAAASHAFRGRPAPLAPLAWRQDQAQAPEGVAIVGVLTATVLRLVVPPKFTHLLHLLPRHDARRALRRPARRGCGDLLSALIADYFWMDPARSLVIANPSDGAALAIFVATCLILSWLAEKLRRTKRARSRSSKRWSWNAPLN